MARQKIMEVYRLEGGAVDSRMTADIDVDEYAAIMESVSNIGKALGFSPGEVMAAHGRVMMARRGLVPARPE